MAGSDQVNRNLAEYVARTKAALLALAQHYAAKMEGQAKQEAKWEDRTGHARQGLFGDTQERDSALVIRLGHSVDYGVYLELANQGRFAVLEPVVKRNAPDFFRDAKRVVEG